MQDRQTEKSANPFGVITLALCSMFPAAQAQASTQRSDPSSSHPLLVRVDSPAKYGPILTDVEREEFSGLCRQEAESFKVAADKLHSNALERELASTIEVERQRLSLVQYQQELNSVFEGQGQQLKLQGEGMQSALASDVADASARSTAALDRMRQDVYDRMETAATVAQVICSGAMLGASLSAQAASHGAGTESASAPGISENGSGATDILREPSSLRIATSNEGSEVSEVVANTSTATGAKEVAPAAKTVEDGAKFVISDATKEKAKNAAEKFVFKQVVKRLVTGAARRVAGPVVDLFWPNPIGPEIDPATIQGPPLPPNWVKTPEVVAPRVLP